ncbi:MAG TPA: branched-chain amino acid ABC transporter permease [Xanthobacteraceae bacterium]|nr:branched-chain amino acid ABC transporter permease [Xanthobacteraceae bacterium]
MLYREAGQFKTSYASDAAIFPIAQDRWFVIGLLLFGFFILPLFANQYLYTEVLIPVLILSLAAIGLNILTGYCGQLSLGTGGFMAVGAYAAYNLMLRVPETNLILVLLFGGLMAMLVGVLFGIPSLRIKGFYLAVATLAAQFFIEWAFARVKWFTNYAPSGSVAVGQLEVFGVALDTPMKKYLFVLAMVALLALAAKNLVRSRLGRMWMAMRDMDIAAEIIGIRPLHAKLSAFAVSSFYIGIAGALWAFLRLGSWEPLAFDINRSFQILFMIIIGGLGSILGSFLGAAFIVLVPIFLNQFPGLLGISMSTALISHLEFMIFGAMIVFFLIVEPHGLARLWAIAKEKLRLWPFPY